MAVLRERDCAFSFGRTVLAPGETVYLRIRVAVEFRPRRLLSQPGTYLGRVLVHDLTIDGTHRALVGPVPVTAFLPSRPTSDVPALSGHCLPGSEVVLRAENTSGRRVALHVVLIGHATPAVPGPQSAFVPPGSLVN